ncbi:hypothetical protein DL96DRAFT_1685011 [Flagelloscypha sp. PMI_526]|nr:hypothetical protein DL96DRAFT_1685011 [Flagelloscypha sp. PMI_526]
MSDSPDMKEKSTVAEVESSSYKSDHAVDVDALDPATVSRIKRRVDFRIIPIMSLLYAVALIDRTNMGIARVAGMGVDLKLTVGDRYSIASCIYFVPYIVLQLPSNLVLRRLGPRNWMTICVVGWGVSQLGMGFVKNWHQLSACRALLGVFEAGFFPAMVFIISTWYTRREVQKRMAFFYLGSIFLSGFATIFAYALSLLKGRGGLNGWQWIFIIMGLITIVLGLAAFLFLPHFPDKNTFLSDEHTKIVLARVEKDRGDSMPDKLTTAVVLGHLKDWTIWAYALMFMCNTMPAYAIGFFITIILKSMGWNDVHAFVLSAPPYVAAAVACFCFAWIADRTMKRAIWIALQALITITGISLLGFHKNSGVRYFGIFLVNMGASSGVPAVLAYSANNVIGHSKRAVSTAMIISFGGIGGIFATTAFREKDFPTYRGGIWATIACQLLLLILLAITTLTYRSRNKAAKESGRVLEGSSQLTPTNVPRVTQNLDDLHSLLSEAKQSEPLTKALIEYIFLPLSTILQRNSAAHIPDRVLENILRVLEQLIEDWWAVCDEAIWTQLFMLCGATVGGLNSSKGKAKERDDETKLAAVRCILQLVHPRPDNMQRVQELVSCAQKSKFVPVLGQTIDSLLVVAESSTLALQLASLETIHHLVSLSFVPRSLSPTILPGVVSTTCKVALGTSSKKGWSNGDLVSRALRVLQDMIVSAIADDVCREEGAIRSIETLEDLVGLVQNEETPVISSKDGGVQPAYAVQRSASWLQGTSSQLHMAINSLSSLLSHPTPSALIALTKFAEIVAVATPTTLPQTQPLLLSWLLRLDVSDFPSVKLQARASLTSLLTSTTHSNIPDVLITLLNDNLAALPRLILSGADSRVVHVSSMIEATCLLATAGQKKEGHILGSLLGGIGHILGPAGGVEKWGWSLLSVLRLEGPSIVTTSAPAGQLHLEDAETQENPWSAFPSLSLQNVSTHEGYSALVGQEASMLSTLWSGSSKQDVGMIIQDSVAALWLSARLLEGTANISLELPFESSCSELFQSPRLRKLTRMLTSSIAELWDALAEMSAVPAPESKPIEERDDLSKQVQHLKGIEQLDDNLRITRLFNSQEKKQPPAHPAIHRSLLLQLLALSCGIMQMKFTRTFIHSLYPILHSLISPYSVLSATALATLHFITVQTSYASPANLLLSNFDYALDSVSRRLTRRWLDLDAPKVLVVLVRLVGEDVVQRAGDVVEECFDRLDDYHGYSVLVDGLTEVLGEVVNVIAISVNSASEESKPAPPNKNLDEEEDTEKYNGLLRWIRERKNPLIDQVETEEFGPTPQRPWGQEKESEEQPEDADPDPDNPPPPTPTQTLTIQIVTRASYMLSHRSPVIKARVLSLLATSVPVLSPSSLMPAVNTIWPFILNRLSDPETFVVSAAASLLEAFATSVGDFIFHKLWDDVWPRFHTLLRKLEDADKQSALVRRGAGIGTESAYTHSHRLYKAVLRTMTEAAKGVDPKDSSIWEVIMAFRRFLHSQVHEELQALARELYIALSIRNADAVWLALKGTFSHECGDQFSFMREAHRVWYK